MSYAYDMFGRFHSVSSSVASACTYGYLDGSDLLEATTFTIGSSTFDVRRSYESGRSLVTSVENCFGETVISRYDYANDALGRRTSRADSGLAFAAQPTYGDSATVEMPAYNAYSYNTRSEVTGATRRWGTPGASGDLVLGQQYAYAFDSIGNRITAAEGDASRSASYTANALNQYTLRTVPDEKDLIGTAPTNVAVTVNQNLVSRQNAYWHHALEVDNATDAAYPHVAITAVYNPPGTNDPDVVIAHTGRVFVAETPEQFTYDDDGNLTQDGRFDYTWNGENRLIKAETRDDLPVDVPCVKVEYAYDHQGRMVWKQVSTNAVVVSTRTLIWDGYNIVQALIHSQTHTITNSFTWGLDLSGTLQGAGGVGGLLAEVQNGVPYLPAFDANGNVTEYLSTDGTIAAHYEYSPFGEIVVQSGVMADAFTHRFSTKPWCPVTGLSEYLFRKYSPGMGRWMSRDPIFEFSWWLRRYGGEMTSIQAKTVLNIIGRQGENNESAFLKNFTSGAYDAFGLACQYNAVLGKCTKPKPGFIPSSNGCGPAGSLGKFVPNDPMKFLPPFFVSCPFTDACNYHDLCYGWCNSVKGDCDYALYQAIEGACLTCYENNFSRWDPRGWIWLGDCAALAGVYYGVVSAGGNDPFFNAQEAGCESCCCQ